ncbi:hypothetical protein EK904_003685, partial [Melospiza melodia maxima]
GFCCSGNSPQLQKGPDPPHNIRSLLRPCRGPNTAKRVDKKLAKRVDVGQVTPVINYLTTAEKERSLNDYTHQAGWLDGLQSSAQGASEVRGKILLSLLQATTETQHMVHEEISNSLRNGENKLSTSYTGSFEALHVV